MATQKSSAPKKTPPVPARSPKRPSPPPIRATDLKMLLAVPAQIEACTQRVLDKLTSFTPAAAAANLPQIETGTQNAAARLDALLTIFSGKSAQQVLQDMLETGNAPTRAQLLELADKMIARSPVGRAA